MSAIEKILTYARDLILITERLNALSKSVGDLGDRMNDHERRLIRIEALIEFSMRAQLPPVGASKSPEPTNASTPLIQVSAGVQTTPEK